MPPWAVVTVPVYMWPGEHVKVYIPLDALVHLEDGQAWEYHPGEVDLFPAGFTFTKHNGQHYSFRMRARLFGAGDDVIRGLKTPPERFVDFRNCPRSADFSEEYLAQLPRLRV